MILFDINVLIYAMRSDMPAHPAAHEYLRRTIDNQTPIAWNGQFYSGVVRILTNPRFPAEQSDVRDVIAFLDWFESLPTVTQIAEGPQYWRILKDLIVDYELKGGQVTDAAFAALAIENRALLVSFDRDFRRFKDLKLDLLEH